MSSFRPYRRGTAPASYMTGAVAESDDNDWDENQFCDEPEDLLDASPDDKKRGGITGGSQKIGPQRKNTMQAEAIAKAQAEAAAKAKAQAEAAARARAQAEAAAKAQAKSNQRG